MCLLFGVLALLCGAYALLCMPHEKRIDHIGIFLFKLLPFAFAALSISLFDPKRVQRWKLNVILIYACFGIFFFWYVPKLFFVIFLHIEQVRSLYYLTLIMTPALILGFTLAFRLGGGSSSNCLRIAFGSLTLMISGLEDLLFVLINPHTPGKYNPMPEVWHWTEHIRVRIGHFPTKYEAYIFIAVHLAVATFITFHHFRWLRPLRRPLGLDNSHS